MRRAVKALFFVAMTTLALIATIILAAGNGDKKSHVVQINNELELLAQVEQGKKIWFLQFTRESNCPECETANAEFEKAARALVGSVAFASITDAKIAERHSVKGFPSYHIFAPAAKKGDKATTTEFGESRTAAKMVEAALAAAKNLLEARVPPKKEEEPPKQEEGAKKQASNFYENSEVINLSDETFEQDVLNGKDAWLIEFYAPWCGHCKNLLPHWKEAAAANTGVKVAAVDATVHTKFSNKYGVQGFPTIKFFKPESPDQTPEDYNGGRTTESIVSYLQDKAAQYGKSGTPIAIDQVSEQSWFESDKCLKDKLLCVVFVLPHVAFTGAAGRNEQLAMLGKVVGKFRSRQTGFGWIAGGDHSKFEKAFGVVDNYPTFVAFGKSKGQIKFSTPSAEKFEEADISDHLNKILNGRKSMSVLKGATELPQLTKGVAPWDGKDYVESDE